MPFNKAFEVTENGSEAAETKAEPTSYQPRRYDKPEIIHPQDAETEQEKKIRYRSIRIGHMAMFIFATGFSIILTGVYPYMKEVNFEIL